jgi:hypothetical protein
MCLCYFSLYAGGEIRVRLSRKPAARDFGSEMVQKFTTVAKQITSITLRYGKEKNSALPSGFAWGRRVKIPRAPHNIAVYLGTNACRSEHLLPVRGAPNFIDNGLRHCQRKSGIPQCGI